jgi:hypothetical protein
MKLNQRNNMNAPPLISHRLLVSAVAEHRSVHTLSAGEEKQVIIDRNAHWSAPSWGVEKSVPTVRAVTARRLLTPAMISASWPFFE